MLIWRFFVIGDYTAGLMSDGCVFLWHKDTDELYYIQGIPELQSDTNSSYGKYFFFLGIFFI